MINNVQFQNFILLTDHLAYDIELNIPKLSPGSPKIFLCSTIRSDSGPFKISTNEESEMECAMRVLKQEGDRRSTDDDDNDDGGYDLLGAELIDDQCILNTVLNKEGTESSCQGCSSGTTSSPNSPISVSLSCDPPDSLTSVQKVNIVARPIEAISVDHGLKGHAFELKEWKVPSDEKPNTVQATCEARNRDQLEERNRNQPEERNRDQLEERNRDQLEERNRDQVEERNRDQLEERNRDQLEERNRDQLEERNRDQLEERNRDQLEERNRDQLEERNRDQLEERNRDQLEERNRDQLEERNRDQLEERNRDQLEERNRDQLEERNDSDDQQEEENDTGHYASGKMEMPIFEEDSEETEENSDEEPNLRLE